MLHWTRNPHAPPKRATQTGKRNPAPCASSPGSRSEWLWPRVGIFVGREICHRYKFKRRTPYDFYSNAGERQASEFGVGI